MPSPDRPWVDGLTFNRLSGAVYHELLAPANVHLTEDQAVDLPAYARWRRSILDARTDAPRQLALPERDCRG